MAEHTDAIPYGPPLGSDEAAALVGSLERQRTIVAWKCGGLDAAGLRATTAASTITLGGLLKHLALVEDDYFTRKVAGNEPTLWTGVDWDATPDWDWDAKDDTPEELMALWQGAVERSRAALTEALASGGLDQRITRIENDRGESPNLRGVLLDLIEEYARHAGHADVIRESIDGVVGEDPPWLGQDSG